MDSGTVIYILYRRDNYEPRTIYDGDDLERGDEITALSVANLGELGWEAISVARREDDGAEHWFFKRRIHPSNQYLTFRRR